MNRLNQNLLSSLDNIEECIVESEMNVCISLCEHYTKIATYMNYSSNSDVHEYMTIFQESEMTTEETPSKAATNNKHEFILIRIIKSIGNLFKKIAHSIVVQIRGVGRIVKNIFTHDEYVKGFKNSRKNGSKYNDLSMSGVPEFEGTVPEIENAETPVATGETNDSKAPELDNDSDITQIFAVVAAYEWIEKLHEKMQLIIKSVEDKSSDVNQVVKNIKNAKTECIRKFNKYETFNGSANDTLKKLLTKIKSKKKELDGHSKLEILEMLAELSEKLGESINSFANNLATSKLRDDIKNDESKMNVFMDYIKTFENSVTGFSATISEMLKQIKDIIKNANSSSSAQPA